MENNNEKKDIDFLLKIKRTNQALGIVGSSRVNGAREEDDFYPTPAYAVEALLAREEFKGTTWECACGDGAISEVLKSKGMLTYSSDLIDRGYGDDHFDFLTSEDVGTFNNIITNPPFKFAKQFIEKSKLVTTDKIAMFLKTTFLESEARYEMFHDTEYRLKCMYQFSKRVSLSKGGEKSKNSGMIAFAWYVFDKSWTGEPVIRWIR